MGVLGRAVVHADPAHLVLGGRGELGLETEVLSGMMLMDSTGDGGDGPWKGDFRIDWDLEL